MERTQASLHALELDKILDMLSDRASFQDVREAALQVRPFSRFEQVKEEMGKTEEAYQLMMRYGSPTIPSIQSPVNSLARAKAGGYLTMGELLSIATVLRAVRSLSQWKEHSAGASGRLDGYFDSLSPNKYLEEKITSAIVSEDEMSDFASPELANIRRKIKSAQAKARTQLEKLVHSATQAKYLQDQIITMRDSRFVVPVKAEYRSEIKGLVHDTSASGATVFIEPMAVVEANNEIRVLTSQEKAEMDRILQELSGEAGSFADGICEDYRTMAELDLLFSKARLGADMKAIVPVINDEGRINLVKARHPLIAKEKVVPTDIRLGSDFDTLVITGPNTGGKTVAIKTVGLLTLMAMCGMMVPAFDNSELSFFRYVLADIGDEQSIEQSLSTFSSHMTNIISVLNLADEHTLVLVDELGAGTDPVEGAALAIAILETLRASGTKIIATTHYAELKVFALETPGVENGSCEFDVSTLRPTYRLMIGIPGRSNAFAISQRLGLSDYVVGRAQELVSAESKHFEHVVDNLESARQKLEEELSAAKAEREESSRLLEEARQVRERLELDREKGMERARREAQRLVDDLRYDAEQLMKELEEVRREKNAERFNELLNETKATTGKKLRRMEDRANPVERRERSGYRLPRPLKVGDTVRIQDIGKEATVIALPDKNGEVLVQAGIVKTKVKQNNLVLKEDAPAVQVEGKVIRTFESKASKSARPELNLIGKNVEEASIELEQYLDTAVMMGLGQVTIIHGKGTGVLRKGVHSLLKANRHVKSFRLGAFGEGEAGVTVVELK